MSIQSSFVGEIRMFGGKFAPDKWVFCNGQHLSVQDHQALFDVIGTIYGGNGVTTFAVPDLRGRSPIHHGTGPGLSPRAPGESGGDEHVTLKQDEMAAHPVAPRGIAFCVRNHRTPTGSPVNAIWGRDPGVASATYHQGPANAKMAPGVVGLSMHNAGDGQSHANMQPFQCVNFIIALTGPIPTQA